jgi:hypothetical protein
MREIFQASENGEISLVEEYLQSNGDIDLKDEVCFLSKSQSR